MTSSIYRNDSLIQMETYETEPDNADELVRRIRHKWVVLRDAGLAGDYPIEILRSDGPRVKVVEIFRWRTRDDRARAQQDEAYQHVGRDVSSLALTAGALETFTEAVRGFSDNFPRVGGVELLKGVCSCLLTVDGLVKDYPMSVKNGIVLMHRSPRTDFDGDGKNEMYLKILMHGGETIQAALGPIRVEQNFSRPNDGIVKSDGIGDTDFPGTAIWRVSWRIQTAMGPVLTDPTQPLVFGPATVSHYPPVGTQFHASTGPVPLVLESTGQRVGTLVPGELTAFDIVITKDDEIVADILNAPPADIFSLLDDYVALAKTPSGGRE